MVVYRKRFQRTFDWKYEAENFVRKIRAKAEKAGHRVKTKIVSVRAFSSSTAQRWNIYNRFVGSKSAETKTVAYCVRWEYSPPKKK